MTRFGTLLVYSMAIRVVTILTIQKMHQLKYILGTYIVAVYAVHSRVAKAPKLGYKAVAKFLECATGATRGLSHPLESLRRNVTHARTKTSTGIVLRLDAWIQHKKRHDTIIDCLAKRARDGVGCLRSINSCSCTNAW